MPQWTYPGLLALGVLVLFLAGLGIVANAVIAGFTVSYQVYHRNLYLFAYAAVVFGAWTLGRVSWIVLQGAPNYPIYQREIVIDVIFWLVAPPIWFFVEYFMFDCRAVPPPPSVTLPDHLQNLRAYADYASKIWAALSALLLGVAAIMFQK